MAGSNILREFLVAIGFDVDENSYRNFQSKLEKTTTQFAQFGKTAILAGAALGATILKTSSDLEKLYYSAQRAGTSVGNLMGLRLGGQQAGIGADAIASAVENMASTIRSNPGMLMFFRQMGIAISPDNVKNFESLISKLRDMDARGGGVLARLIGKQFGFDEQTLTLLFKNWPAYLAGRKEEEKILRESGIDMQKLAEQGVKFSREWNVFSAHALQLGYLLADHVLPTMDRMVVALTKAVEFMVRLDQATHGWSTTIAGVLAAFGTVLGGLSLLRGLAGMAGLAGGGAAAAGGGAALGGPVVWAIVGVVATAVLAWMALHNDRVKILLHRTTEAAGGFIARWEGKILQTYRDITGKLTIGFGHLVKPGENFLGGITDAQARQLLAQDTAAARNSVLDLVKVKLNQNQLEALTDFVYNLGSERFAKSTLLKDINAGNFAAAGDEFMKWNHAMVNGRMTEVEGLTQRRASERELFNRPDVSIDQHTEITVTGANDPRETGRRVAGEQNRVNGDLLRNLAGAVQ